MRTPHNLMLFAIIATTLLSCKQKTEKTTASTKPLPIDVIREYYNKVEKLKLPLNWNEYLAANTQHILFTDNDTLEFGQGVQEHSLIGVFPDTSKYFGFLLSYPGDDVYPIIMTFDKMGKRISFESDFNYGCGGSDCEYICNYSDFIVEKNLFYSITKSYIKACEDETENMDTTNVEYRVTEVHGQISRTGKVKVEKAKDVEFKTWPYNSPENPMRKHK